MKKLSALLLLLTLQSFSWTAPCRGQQPSTQASEHVLLRVKDIAALSNSEAAHAIPVKIEGTVTFAEAQDDSLFIEDQGSAIYVNFDKEIGLRQGDRVIVSGVTAASFRPEVNATDVRVLAHGKLPTPIPAKFEDLIQSRLDCQFVSVAGHVLAAAMDQESPEPGLRIRLRLPQGMIVARIAHPGNLKPEDLMDSDIRLAGVAAGDFDSKMQMIGIWMDVNSGQDVDILHRPGASPWSIPAIPMDDVLATFRDSNESQRVKISGTLTYYEPGSLAVLEQQGRSMLVETDSTMSLHTGMEVEATGFPAIVQGNLQLESGQLRSIATSKPQPVETIAWEKAAAGKSAYNLVAMEGQVVGMVHDSRVDMFIIVSNGHLFSASLRHSSSDANLTAVSFETPEVGTRVKVTGVCFVAEGNHWRDRLWFDIRMRSLGDIVILQQPSWWTVKRLAYVITFMSAMILIAVIWAGLLDRRLRRQTAIVARQSQEDAMRERRLARQEQQRSKILELISSSAPLADVLREIMAMVSTRLLGASCWFELRADAGAEDSLERPAGPAIIFQELFSRDGVSLGFLLATPQLFMSDEPEISAAMVAGARLAELAIDTRRLYSDLRHRSEHDLLTDIPNRFSMEKKLDQLMQSARRNEASFGMIYVDLDRFKQVNDRYGHRIGDLYLKEVTRRMKLQLRHEDTLARIGGDEFIALVPILRNPTDAEEIAKRLDHCFDEPFNLEGIRLKGSASIGLAIYPDEGTTEEELQRAADAAMYVHKESKREQQRLNEVNEKLWSGDLLR